MSLKLSDAIQGLRSELSLAQEKGGASELKFEIEEIELELHLVAEENLETRAEVEVSGGIWQVLTGKVAGSVSGGVAEAATHRVKLKMKLPKNADGSPKLMGGSGTEPGS